jgi:hypothetical protein
MEIDIDEDIDIERDRDRDRDRDRGIELLRTKLTATKQYSINAMLVHNS